MPDLSFQVTGVEAVARGLSPLLQFKLFISNQPEVEVIHTIALHAQIQIQSPQRSYNATEKARLIELFGRPDRWGQTLRNRLWGLSETTVRGFSATTGATLAMPCTFDLNIAATKYFQALEGDDVPLLFLFSGSVFYEGKDGRLQVQQIPWDRECVFRMPVGVWREMMDHHYPNCAWLYLERSTFDDLAGYKRANGFATWDQAISTLLASEQKQEVVGL
jgi:hypothetical protein